MSKKITTKSRKRLTLALVCTMCLTLLVGSFAFFTDRADVSAEATAGNLAIALSENGNGTTSITEQLKLGGQYGSITNGAALDNWSPGDIIPFSYTVTNSGNKAIRVEETLTLKVAATGNNGTFTDNANSINSMFTIVSSDGTTVIDAANVKETLDDGKKVWTLVYNLDEFALSSANGEILDSAANVTASARNGQNAVDATKAAALRTFQLKFDKAATNIYQDAEIDISVHVDAIQYANSTDIAANGISEAAIEQELHYTNAAGIAA